MYGAKVHSYQKTMFIHDTNSSVKNDAGIMMSIAMNIVKEDD